MTAANSPMPDIGNLTVESDSITIVDGRIRWMRNGTLIVERGYFGAEEVLARQRDEAYTAMAAMKSAITISSLSPSTDPLVHAKSMQEARKVMAQLYQSAEDFMAIYDEGDAPNSEQDKALRDKMSDAFQWLIEDVQSCVERDKLIRSATKYGGATVSATQPAAASERVLTRMSTDDEAREYLVTFMETHFSDKTFHRYIRGPLAGDFAWQMAQALVAANKPAAPAAAADLQAALQQMRAAFHVNMLRAFPNKSHDEIAAEIDKACNLSASAAQPGARDDEPDEVAFWRFDARKKGYSEWRECPQSERDAFKAEWRMAFAAVAERPDEAAPLAAPAAPVFQAVARYCGAEFSRYTIEWTNGPLPEGTELFAKAVAAAVPEWRRPTQAEADQWGERNGIRNPHGYALIVAIEDAATLHLSAATQQQKEV